MIKCKICEIEKPLDDYYFTDKELGKRRKDCIPCVKEKASIWANNNKQHRKDYTKKMGD